MALANYMFGPYKIDPKEVFYSTDLSYALVNLRPVVPGKFGAFFASIPLPIFAAIYCVLWGIVVGISYIQFTNHNSMRNNYVLGLTLFLGISIPYYFWSYTTANNHGPVKTDGGWMLNVETRS